VIGHDLSDEVDIVIGQHIDAVLLSPLPGETMFPNCNYSPLQHLAAFAIVFVAAVVGTAAVGAYVDSVKADAQQG
jgi:hypothetical protein